MSGKLDQSLDEILSTRRAGGTRGRASRRPRAGRAAAAAAPVGGVKKNTKQAAKAPVPSGPAGRSGEGKISVSNLPKDVNEAQIKEYFGSSVGPIKRVELQYGPNGASRGKATVIFSRAESATKASKELNGLLVDGKPMVIEMIIDAKNAASLPAPKGLGERIQQKPQPKSAANAKATTNGGKATEGRGRGAARGRGAGKGRGGRPARPAKKTAEELDSEMADYFDNGNTAATESGATSGNAAAPAANGDAMDEVL